METDNFIVSNIEIVTFDVIVSKHRIFMKKFHNVVDYLDKL